MISEANTTANESQAKTCAILKIRLTRPTLQKRWVITKNSQWQRWTRWLTWPCKWSSPKRRRCRMRLTYWRALELGPADDTEKEEDEGPTIVTTDWRLLNQLDADVDPKMAPAIIELKSSLGKSWGVTLSNIRDATMQNVTLPSITPTLVYHFTAAI